MNKELLYRFFNQETTFDEERQIKLWLEKSESNRKILFKERKFFDACLIHADIYASDKKIDYKRTWRRIAVAISSVAAMLLLTITGTIKYIEHKFNDVPNNIINVPQGQRVNLTLADGTQVWLNSNTCMTYPQTFIGSSKREIKIDGEGYFEVTKDKNKPFVVNTNHGNIEVLGTKFYVTAYSKANQFETSLIEGSIKVSTNSQELILKPNNKLVLMHGQLFKDSISDMSVYRWREGLYCFVDKSFDNVLKQFELYFDVKFVKQNSHLSNPRITGKFKLIDGVDYALKILQKEVKFTYQRDEESDIIYIK